ncbi:hypothetical protein HY623_00175 [Candidatus Uhrbacteria bacterium]|nr:hypothetical protein [Candidatus Uhrbacteria bacterium]
MSEDVTQKGDAAEKPRPAKLDRNVLGRIRLIVDGEDGKSGIGALARRVEALDKDAERLREERQKAREVVDNMKERSGELIGALHALFTRAQATLQKTEEKCASVEQEIREKSSMVCDGIAVIEKIVDEYAKNERQYQAAEQMQKILEKMKVFAGICETVLHSIARLQKSGKAGEITVARELFGRNVSLLQSMLGEYQHQAEKNPRVRGDLPTDFSEIIIKGNFTEAKKHIDETLSSLKEKMGGYVAGIKRNLPDNLGALLTEKEKNYFEQRAHASSNDNTDLSKNNS